MRVAVIDCGTNTVRLLIAEVDADNGLRDVAREQRFVRLGENVDATGRFQDSALQRLSGTVAEYAAIINQAGVSAVRFVATSAARDVSNREEFAQIVRSGLGVEAEVISGEEEAELSFLGALAGGPLPGGETGSVLVVDLGGGSTELIRGGGSGRVEAAVSLNVGSVRLRERFLHADPPTADQADQARQFVSGLLETSPVNWGAVDTWIGVAGTFTSLSAMNLGLDVYDRSTVHGSQIAVSDIDRLSQRLLGLTVAETIAAYPSLQPMRAEVIAAGALICAELARRLDVPLTVRDTDILDGTALKLVRWRHPTEVE